MAASLGPGAAGKAWLGLGGESTGELIRRRAVTDPLPDAACTWASGISAGRTYRRKWRMGGEALETDQAIRLFDSRGRDRRDV